jgi:hypothetical protein
MQSGKFYWRRDKQFGRIAGSGGEEVIFDRKMPHDLNLNKEHKGTPVNYKARKIHTIPNTYYAIDVRKV